MLNIKIPSSDHRSFSLAWRIKKFYSFVGWMLRSAVRAERAGSRVSIFVSGPYWADLFRLSLGFNSELCTSHHKHWTQSRSNYWEDGWGSMMGMKLFKTITNDLHFVRVNSFVRWSGDGVTYLCRNLTFSVNQEPDKRQRQRRHWHRPRNVAAPNTHILQRSYLSGAVLCTMYHVPCTMYRVPCTSRTGVSAIKYVA